MDLMELLEKFIVPGATLLLGTILGNFISFHNKSRELQDSLDARSNWRVNLVDIASKECINLDDVYRLRAALRNVKHDPFEVELYSFDFMTNAIINICETIINTYDTNIIGKRKQEQYVKKTYITNKNDREIIRICCRFLLKHQWEYLTKSYKNPIVSKMGYNSKVNETAEDVCKEIERYGGRIDFE